MYGCFPFFTVFFSWEMAMKKRYWIFIWQLRILSGKAFLKTCKKTIWRKPSGFFVHQKINYFTVFSISFAKYIFRVYCLNYKWETELRNNFFFLPVLKIGQINILAGSYDILLLLNYGLEQSIIRLFSFFIGNENIFPFLWG